MKRIVGKTIALPISSLALVKYQVPQQTTSNRYSKKNT